MARVRDYKAEYAKRKAAREAKGITRDYKAEYKRAKQNAIDSGFKSVRAKKAQAKTFGPMERPSRNPILSGVRTSAIYQQCLAWSKANAVTHIARFTPGHAGDMGMSLAEYTLAYYAAWLSYERGQAGNDALEYWLTDVMNVYSPEEYDARYGDPS